MFTSAVDGGDDEVVGVLLPPRPAARLVLWILLAAAGLNGLVVRGNDHPVTAERCHDGDGDEQQQHQKKATNTFVDFIMVLCAVVDRDGR